MVCPDSSLRCMAKRSPVLAFFRCVLGQCQAPLFLPDAYGANRQAGVLIKSLFSNFPLPNVDAETQARAPEGKSEPKQDAGAAQRHIETHPIPAQGGVSRGWRFDTAALPCA